MTKNTALSLSLADNTSSFERTEIALRLAKEARNEAMHSMVSAVVAKLRCYGLRAAGLQASSC